MKIDINSLTLGEIAKFEDLSNQSIQVLGNAESPKGRALAALAFIIKRRTGDPHFTWQAAQELTMDEANEILGLADDDEEETPDLPPTESEPKKKSAPKK